MKKSAQVVMLSTNEKADLRIGKTHGVLHYKNNTFDENLGIYQHFYILSNEEIKEVDWFVGFADGSIKPFVKQADESTVEINNWQLNKKGHSSNKKIIATTDRSLNTFIESKDGNYTEHGQGYFKELPQPPQSFIEYFVAEYNKGNVITEVMVEYEWGKTGKKVREVELFDDVLKINPDNTINISMPKDSWSREEVIKLFYKNIEDRENPKSSKYQGIEKWIEENL